MRRSSCFLLALALTAAATPAAAQERVASAGREGTFFFRAEVPFNRQLVPYTPDQVWAALPEAYRLIGFTVRPASTAADAHRDVVTPYMQIRGQLYPGEPNSRYFECSRNSLTGPLADQGEVTFAMTSRVEPDDKGGTQLLTQLSARVKRRDASQYPVDCVSTGLLERTLAGFLKQHLDNQKIPAQ